MKSKLFIASLLWIAFANTAWGSLIANYYAVVSNDDTGSGYIYISEEELDYDKVPFSDSEYIGIWSESNGEEPANGTPYWIYAKPKANFKFVGWKRANGQAMFTYEEEVFSTSLKQKCAYSNEKPDSYLAVFSQVGGFSLSGIYDEFNVFVNNKQVEADDMGVCIIDGGETVRIEWQEEGNEDEVYIWHFDPQITYQTVQHGITFTMPYNDIYFSYVERKGYKLTGVPDDFSVYVNGYQTSPEDEGIYYILPDKPVKMVWNGNYRYKFTPEVQFTEVKEHSISFKMPSSNLDFTAIGQYSLGESGNSTLLAKIEEKTCDLKLTGLTLYTDDCWNTLCLPFNVGNLKGTPLEGFTVMSLDTSDGGTNTHATGFDNGTLYLNFSKATSIEAGIPYIVKKLDMTDNPVTPTYTHDKGTNGWTTAQACGSDRLIDGGSGAGHNWWPSFSIKPVFCEFYADSPVNVTGYTLTTGNQKVAQDPTEWALKAKLNDGDEWTIIDSRNANENSSDALPSGRSVKKSYNISADKQGRYQYFRFEVTANGGANYMCLSELTLQASFDPVPVNVVSPEFKDVVVSATTPSVVTSSDEAVSFKGCYDAVSIAGEDKSLLFLGADNKLYYPKSAMSIGAFHAFFQLGNGILCGQPSAGGNSINSFVLNFGDNATGIGEFSDKSDRSDEAYGWYSIDGRKLSGKPAQKGIYINNGRKVVIK